MIVPAVSSRQQHHGNKNNGEEGGENLRRSPLRLLFCNIWLKKNQISDAANILFVYSPSLAKNFRKSPLSPSRWKCDGLRCDSRQNGRYPHPSVSQFPRCHIRYSNVGNDYIEEPQQSEYTIWDWVWSGRNERHNLRRGGSALRKTSSLFLVHSLNVWKLTANHISNSHVRSLTSPVSKFSNRTQRNNVTEFLS